MRSPRIASRLSGCGLSRRRVLASCAGAGATLALAACGDPIVVERVVVVTNVVEREVVVERPVVTEREVIVEQEIVVEREVIVTRLVTPPPTPAPTPPPAPPAPRRTVATPETPPPPLKALLRAAISPAYARGGAPDLGRVGTTTDLTLEVLDAGGDSSARLLARAAAGDLPDLLIGVPGGLVTALDAMEALAPLDTALGEEHGFLPEMLALGRRDRGLVGMPVSGHPTYLLASRRRLEQGGVADVDATYPELTETARRLTDPETSTYGFGVVAGLPELETVVRSAGLFPTSEAALNAWQWYADQWLHERVSPPPNAWDGQGAAGEAVVHGRVALAIAHGRALQRLATLPRERNADWEALPLPAWPEAERQIPMAAAFIASVHAGDAAAAGASVALAGPARTFDAGGTSAWTLALDGVSERLRLDVEQLLDARAAWTVPLVETAGWQAQPADLDSAVHNSLTLGQPAAEVAAALQSQSAQPQTA